MKLFSVFSDNALFQGSSTLTLRGVANKGDVVCVSLDNCEYSAVTSDNGIFEVEVVTPASSFEKYEITVTCGEETVVLKNILFGELWLASGQSNMELTNSSINECDWYLDKLKEYDIRVFDQIYGDREKFSTIMQDDLDGKWVSTLKPEDMRGVSACGTAFVYGLVKRFEEMGKNVPVGFLNVSWGATTIEAWLPYDKMRENEKITAFLNKYNRNYTEENINNTDVMIIQKPTVMFNRKISPILGVKVKGIIWYQGESNIWCEFEERVYAELLGVYYETYKNLFACDDSFKVISSLIYPWRYYDDGDTCVGYINEAFVKTALENPDKFICCPNYDLPPSWHSLDNHPIHPMNKYDIGDRLASLCVSNVYGHDSQKSPCFMREVKIEDGRLIVRYDESETGLYTKDGLHVRGMYIAGVDREYLPADCKIISSTEIEVSHPFIENPVHCMYGRASDEVNLNLFSGNYPVMPFATDNDLDTPTLMELKPFLNLEVQSDLYYYEDETVYPDWYYRPVWKGIGDCDVCIDNAFSMISKGYKTSLGVGGKTNPFGMYTESHSHHMLNLWKYSSIEVDVYACGTLDFKVKIDYKNGNGVVVEAICDGTKECEFYHYSADISNIPEEEISRLSFVFSIENVKVMKHVNVGRINLKPKK